MLAATEKLVSELFSIWVAKATELHLNRDENSVTK